MCQMREILRLMFEGGLPSREVARRVGGVAPEKWRVPLM